MYYSYPLEQLFMGFFSGGLLSFVTTWLYLTGKSSAPQEDESSDDSFDDEGSETSSTENDEESSSQSSTRTVISDEMLDKFIDRVLARIPDMLKKFDDLSKGVEKKETGPKEELNTMFEEEVANRSVPSTNSVAQESNVQEKSLPIESSAVGGGYKTLQQFSDMSISSGSSQTGMSRAEELSILGGFRHLVGMKYHDALSTMTEYTLHPLYVSLGSKMPLSSYSSKVIGVRIKDPLFDESTKIPSTDATITEIIDVGGVDVRDMGIIKL